MEVGISLLVSHYPLKKWDQSTLRSILLSVCKSQGHTTFGALEQHSCLYNTFAHSKGHGMLSMALLLEERAIPTCWQGTFLTLSPGKESL